MILYAPNIHTGGGKTLLDEVFLRSALGPVKTFFVDSRYELPDQVTNGAHVVSIQPTLANRLKAEWLLREASCQAPAETVLCFGCLPPSARLSGRTILYMQNALLVPDVEWPKGLAFKTYARLLAEKAWIWNFDLNVDEVWVQTSFMQRKTQAQFDVPVLIKPVLPSLNPQWAAPDKKYDFVAVTSHLPYKRQIDLFSALCELARVGCRAEVVVVTDFLGRQENLCLEQLRDTTVIVEIKNSLTHAQVCQTYGQSRCLINTSAIESFGLPLYEARQLNLEIISCREDYALEVAPGATFYPTGDSGALAQSMLKELAKRPKSV